MLPSPPPRPHSRRSSRFLSETVKATLRKKARRAVLAGRDVSRAAKHKQSSPAAVADLAYVAASSGRTALRFTRRRTRAAPARVIKRGHKGESTWSAQCAIVEREKEARRKARKNARSREEKTKRSRLSARSEMQNIRPLSFAFLRRGRGARYLESIERASATCSTGPHYLDPLAFPGTENLTCRFIQLRKEHGKMFTGRKYSAQAGWE